MKLLLTHDLHCVIHQLHTAALHNKVVTPIGQAELCRASVAFTVQLAIDMTKDDAEVQKLRELEAKLMDLLKDIET